MRLYLRKHKCNALAMDFHLTTFENFFLQIYFQKLALSYENFQSLSLSGDDHRRKGSFNHYPEFIILKSLSLSKDNYPRKRRGLNHCHYPEYVPLKSLSEKEEEF